MLRISVLLGVTIAALLVSSPGIAGKRYQDVDWSEFIETPEDRARWDARARNRPGENEPKADDAERSKGDRKAKKVKKARGKKGRKSAAAARKKRSR